MASKGPGYASPLDAMKNGPKEEILYVCCIQPNPNAKTTDYLGTIDVDPKSKTYCEIIHRLYTGKANDEIHHSGWNICSSCYKDEGCCGAVRDKLVLPCIGSDRILIVDTGKNPRAPVLHKEIDSKEMHAFDCSTPHTPHCLPTGEIMISILGDVKGNRKGDFILMDSKTFEVKGTWIKGAKAKFGYDFWYQPYFDILVSSEFSAPKAFKRGFKIEELNPDNYGSSLNFFSWSKKTLIQTIDLGRPDGFTPMEIRFLHDPKEPQGFVGCAVMANVFRFFMKDDGTWEANKVIDVKPKKVTGFTDPYMQGMLTDIIISLDDKYLYLSNWFHGDVRQYDLTDRANPKLTGQVFLGGKILSDSLIKVIEDSELTEQPKPAYARGKRLRGGPQMLQLSLDGKRLYVSNSLYSPWDKQFYPEIILHGSYIVKIDIDVENGGMKLDQDFLVDFGKGPDGPTLVHEIRYPGGDCSSDIWLA